MAKTPTTSTTLLRDLARDSQQARWGEFVARYRPMMEAYLRERFPHVDVDDAVQETLIALIKSMPVYRYVPEETGRFHSYLTGILRHRALRQVRSDRKRAKIREVLCQNEPQNEIQDDEQSWRESLMEIALQQLLADGFFRVIFYKTWSENKQQIFLRIGKDTILQSDRRLESIHTVRLQQPVHGGLLRGRGQLQKQSVQRTADIFLPCPVRVFNHLKINSGQTFYYILYEADRLFQGKCLQSRKCEISFIIPEICCFRNRKHMIKCKKRN
jgi:RNA polymerase sigma factor (sigma-70 family)